MKTISMILVSHGRFAEAALNSAKMIVGQVVNVRAYSLMEDKSIDDLEREIKEGYEELSKEYDIVLCICDIYGGTPFNAISRCLLNGMNMIAYTGLNLAMLIDLMLVGEIKEDELHERINSTYKLALNEIKVTLSEDKCELDLNDL